MTSCDIVEIQWNILNSFQRFLQHPPGHLSQSSSHWLNQLIFNVFLGGGDFFSQHNRHRGGAEEVLAAVTRHGAAQRRRHHPVGAPSPGPRWFICRQLHRHWWSRKSDQFLIRPIETDVDVEWLLSSSILLIQSGNAADVRKQLIQIWIESSGLNYSY